MDIILAVVDVAVFTSSLYSVDSLSQGEYRCFIKRKIENFPRYFSPLFWLVRERISRCIHFIIYIFF